MTILQINKGQLPSEVIVPASKSYANRALILGAVKTSPVTLKFVPEATDVIHLVEALKKIGLDIHQSGQTIEIRNSFPAFERDGATIETGEGGTTARFLAAFLLLGSRPYTLVLGKRLKERPWDEFINTAKAAGASATLEGDKLHLQGPMKHPARLQIDCSRTTQFATAFDLILPDTTIETLNLKSSQSYLMMNEPLKEHFRNQNVYTIPSDWSSAAYPMVFAALQQTIRFPGLTYDPFQADAKLLEVLNDLGAVETDESGLLVKKMIRPSSVELAMNDCLDLFPAMAFLLSHIEGKHKLTGLENLVHKESDRLTEVTRLLNSFQRNCSYSQDVFTIEGHSRPADQTELTLPDDHRIVMTGALFLRHHNGGKIGPSEAVTKSYPQFFSLMESSC